MTIDRLRDALSAIGPPPDARELSEMLWLACHITPAEERPSPVPPAPPVAPDARTPQPPAPAVPAAPPSPPAPEPRTGLHPRPAPGAEPVGEASEVLVPTAPMLADALGLQRALRPLKRRVPSRHRRELDEEATAARIADTRLWTPVLVPSPERWLTLTLVVDTGPTMRLWRPLARELTETLIRQGAFQNVHVTYLDGTGQVTSAPGAPPQDPSTLLDASGRQAVLVLSDCSGPHWWNGHAPRAVRHWAQAGPAAILQPLAERLWRRTAAPTTPGLAVLPRPAAPNTDLRFTPFDGAVPPGVPVPVLEVAPRWFGTWARLISGSGPQPTAMAALPSRLSGPTPVRRERELPIAERVRRFLATASPEAAELAAHVAVSVPSLPVMRLIQHRILGRSGPGQLAEVLLSGLLRPAGDVRYAFVPGAREALLDTLPRPEALHTRRVLKAVSAEIERRAGTAAETFRALLPTDGGPVTLTAGSDHFALVTPRTRTHLVPGPPVPRADPAPRAPEFDVLRLNGGGPSGMFQETWALPPSEPRSPALGYDPDGDVVTLYPLDIATGIPHGLIVGDPPARCRVMRAITLALAAAYSPRDLTFAFAGLGEHPLGERLDLPHTRYSADELLGSPDALREFTGFLSDEITARSSGAVADPPGLVVFADVSLTFPAGRPEVAESLLTIARRGAALGIQLLVGSTTVESTAIWERFLPLLGWRVAASPPPPAVLQRVFGRADLPFPHERTAYLRASSGTPRRLTVAEEPPAPSVEDFARRARDHWHTIAEAEATPLIADPARHGAARPSSPQLPDRVHVSELPPVTGGRVPIGVEAGTLAPVFVDFDEDPHLVIAGSPASGRANLLRLLIEGVAGRDDDRRAEVHVLDPNGIMQLIADEFGLAEPVSAGVRYTESPAAFSRTVSRVLNGPPATEVFLFVIDREIYDDRLSRLPRTALSAVRRRVHIVLTRLLTSPGHHLDPLVSTLHDLGAPALLLGREYGEETRLYEATPPSPGSPIGRAVLAHRGRRRVIQIAHASPEP